MPRPQFNTQSSPQRVLQGGKGRYRRGTLVLGQRDRMNGNIIQLSQAENFFGKLVTGAVTGIGNVVSAVSMRLDELRYRFG
ncbi:MAG: hypothetical protein OES12_08480 [Anaerolineae bacterium]|nr:hypothetical protein [Anaerolineae bacterium]